MRGYNILALAGLMLSGSAAGQPTQMAVANEASHATKQVIPGSLHAVLNGDPSKHLLAIDGLDLDLMQISGSIAWRVSLNGRIKGDITAPPRVRMTSRSQPKRGQIGHVLETELYSDPEFALQRAGGAVLPGQTLRKGAIEVTRKGHFATFPDSSRASLSGDDAGKILRVEVFDALDNKLTDFERRVCMHRPGMECVD